jgi:hypothetical protein
MPASAWAAAALSRGPYLQKASTDSVVIVWRTDGATHPVVRFGDTPSTLTNQVPPDAITLRAAVDVSGPAGMPRLYQEPPEDLSKREADHNPSTAPNTHQYEARVAGLPANTKRYYAIFDGERLLAGGDAEHFFVTHPPIGSVSDMRIWLVGDSGTGGAAQARVHDAMVGYVKTSGRRIDHYIHVGDMAYSDGTDREFQTGFFAPYQATLRNTVCWPALGNHEGHTSRGLSGFGPYFDAYVVPTRGEVGGVASGTEAYYSFDIAGVHFICLDSHDLDRGTDAAMARWLKADLEQTKAKWLIAFWHHPPYTKGSHDSDREAQLIEMRENFMPILEAAGVDLTLTGHSHIYERSMLIDGAYATPTVAKGVVLNDGDGDPKGDGAYQKSEGLHPHEGSVSIVAGHGGATLGREGTVPIMRQIILEHGSVILDVKGDTLTGIMLNNLGQTRDLFSLVKQGKVTPKRIENPWQPVHDISLLTELRMDFAADTTGAAPKDWSIVQGDSSAVRVVADGRRKLMRGQARSAALIGVYSPYQSKEFELEAVLRVPVGNDKGAGLVFGHVDAQNYGLVVLDVKAGVVRASRFTNGVEAVLDSKPAVITAGQWLRMAVDVEDGVVEIQFQDADRKQPELEFSFRPGGVPAGGFGFYVPAGASVDFRQFIVEK